MSLDGTRRENLAACVLISLIFVAIAMRLLTLGALRQASGPDRVTALADSVYFMVDGYLAEAGVDGELRTVIRGSDLGIQGTISELVAAPGGKLLVAEPANARIQSCDLAARRCDEWLPIADARFLEPFTFDVDDSGTGVLLAPRRELGVFSHDAAAGNIAMIAATASIHIPNRLRYIGDGSAIVTGTFNQAIYKLSPTDAGYELADTQFVTNESVQSQIEAFAGMTLAGGDPKLQQSVVAPVWPIDAAKFSDSTIIAIWADNRFDNGGVYAHDLNTGEEAAEAELPDGFAAQSLAVTDNGLVIASTDYRFAGLQWIDGAFQIAEFGDAALKNWLAERKRRAKLARITHESSLVLLGLLLIGVIFIASRSFRRTQADDNAGESVDAAAA